ncbi:hypothetical protein E4U17_000686 [Claviceps sp. LM77 group G4]|nr:hypothetical protein E4U17_000686 [Claviceps sp. LM77 group G4]KAG6050574.1 hypothetical protein E4U33_000700 [Claviceps sp. LM78 group G4]KAG6066775.1 hypothetical protein E4U16_000193 [Claviceps sp. LM84 group G4]
MAEQEAHLSLASTFPNPPLFWKDFTPERVARIEELRGAFAGAGGSSGASPVVRIPGLPEELVKLQPPLEPADGRWRLYGDQYMLDDNLPTLEDQGIANLPNLALSASKDDKHYDRAFELKKLAKSLLLNFLELVGTLSHCPADAEAKIQDLRTLLINMHHILNEYRPHQARESAIALMQSHLDQTRAETVAIRTQVDKARRVLEGLGSLQLEEPGTTCGQEREPGWQRAQEELAVKRWERELWEGADAAFE